MKSMYKFKRIIRNIQYYVESKIHPNSLMIDWSPGLNNFGDILNPFLVNFMTGKHIINVSTKYCKYDHLLAIGSILDRAVGNSVVWGSGFISDKSKWIEEPKEIFAVRGPKTRNKVLELNKECPEMYGDPALLMPQYYFPNIKKKYKLGLIPHYVDKDHWWFNSLMNDKNVKIIDIQNKNPLKVIDQILECEVVASSSLHGLIIADAYKIPSIWIRFSNLITGGNFKFNDYYLSIGQKEKKPILIEKTTSVNDLISKAKIHEIKLDLEVLKNSFPKSI